MTLRLMCPDLPVRVGDLVVNTRWPWYGTCIVVEMKDDRVIVHHQEGEYAQEKGISWDYAVNWVRLDESGGVNELRS